MTATGLCPPSAPAPDDLRAILGARETEPLADAARRVARSLDAAQAMAESERARADAAERTMARAHETAEAWRERAEAAERDRDIALARVERIAAELEAARSDLGTDQRALDAITRARDERDAERARAMTAELHVERLVEERDAALERCGYYERGHVPRLLGIAPDQLATVRAVLAAAQRWSDAGDRVLRRTEVALVEAVTAWIAAGRPLAGEEMRDADRRGE